MPARFKVDITKTQLSQSQRTHVTNPSHAIVIRTRFDAGMEPPPAVARNLGRMATFHYDGRVLPTHRRRSRLSKAIFHWQPQAISARSTPPHAHRSVKRIRAIGLRAWWRSARAGTSPRRRLASAASTPRKRIRCRRGRGTSAAKRAARQWMRLPPCVRSFLNTPSKVRSRPRVLWCDRHFGHRVQYNRT